MPEVTKHNFNIQLKFRHILATVAAPPPRLLRLILHLSKNADMHVGVIDRKWGGALPKISPDWYEPQVIF